VTPRPDQRRLVICAGLAAAWALVACAAGAQDAIAYLAPTVLLLGSLLLGRYPGEGVLIASTRRVRHRRRRAVPAPALRPAPILLPRGGSLLGTALAGRAPPALA
jgi:hypothetical protein